MTRTELILRLEQQLGLRIPDRAGLAAETPRDLLAAAVPARSAPVDRRPVVTPESIRENIRVPIDSDTINGVLAWHAHAHAKRTHIEIYARDEHVAVSYGELMSRARNVATSLRQRFRRTARAVTASIDGPAIEFVCCGRALPLARDPRRRCRRARASGARRRAHSVSRSVGDAGVTSRTPRRTVGSSSEDGSTRGTSVTSLIRLALRRMEAEPVTRFEATAGADDRSHLEAAVRAGKSLVFFPEGTIVRAPGVQAFHAGAFQVAAAAGVPVVPVSVAGSRSMLRPDQWFPRRASIEVTIEQPLDPESGSWSEALRLRELARAQILQHCREPDLGEASDFWP